MLLQNDLLIKILDRWRIGEEAAGASNINSETHSRRTILRSGIVRLLASQLT